MRFWVNILYIVVHRLLRFMGEIYKFRLQEFLTDYRR